MAAFGADGRCLMRALQEELDDPDPADCGVCAVCTAPRFDGPLDPRLVREAALHLRSRPLILEVKKMAPDAEGKMRKLGEDVRAEEGRALARLGDGGWDPLVRRPPRRPLRRRARRGRGRGRADAGAPRSRWVAAVPSRRSGELVPDFARRLAQALNLPFHPRARARRRQPAAARDGELRPAGRERARRVRGHRRRRRTRPACSSTTSASAAGRSRWSPASSAAGARARSPAGALHGVLAAVVPRGDAGDSNSRLAREGGRRAGATSRRPSVPSTRLWHA